MCANTFTRSHTVSVSNVLQLIFRQGTDGLDLPRQFLLLLPTLKVTIDSIAISVFIDWLSLSNTESEANPNNNLTMK